MAIGYELKSIACLEEFMLIHTHIQTDRQTSQAHKDKEIPLFHISSLGY